MEGLVTNSDPIDPDDLARIAGAAIAWANPGPVEEAPHEHHRAEVVSGELVPIEHGRTLFATDDPVEVLDHARRMADALKTALDQGGMTMRIGRSASTC